MLGWLATLSKDVRVATWNGSLAVHCPILSSYGGSAGNCAETKTTCFVICPQKRQHACNLCDLTLASRLRGFNRTSSRGVWRRVLTSDLESHGVFSLASDACDRPSGRLCLCLSVECAASCQVCQVLAATKNASRRSRWRLCDTSAPESEALDTVVHRTAHAQEIALLFGNQGAKKKLPWCGAEGADCCSLHCIAFAVPVPVPAPPVPETFLRLPSNFSRLFRTGMLSPGPTQDGDSKHQ